LGAGLGGGPGRGCTGATGCNRLQQTQRRTGSRMHWCNRLQQAATDSEADRVEDACRQRPLGPAVEVLLETRVGPSHPQHPVRWRSSRADSRLYRHPTDGQQPELSTLGAAPLGKPRGGGPGPRFVWRDSERAVASESASRSRWDRADCAAFLTQFTQTLKVFTRVTQKIPTRSTQDLCRIYAWLRRLRK
jgi:hypothetical protein